MSVDLSIVIPCLNEAATLERAIGLAQEAVKNSGMSGEVVIADNGSTDGSIEIAQRCGARVVPAPKRGYGNALTAGCTAAYGKYLIMGDADATYDFREAVPFLKDLENGADLVMGSRLRGNIEPGAMPFLHRYLGTPVLSRLIKGFFRLDITDCNCGMRAFTKTAFERLALVSGGMEFASEMIIKCGLYRMKVTERPCSLLKDTRNRPPHLRTWRDGWRHLRFILLFAPHIVFQVPGWFFLLLGIAVTVPILSGPLQIAGRTVDYHYLFYSIPLIIIGYQALWFQRMEEFYVRFAGYLPPDLRREVKGEFKLEWWLAGGALLSLAGAGLLLAIFIQWVLTQFGEMRQIRLGASAMLLLILGVQTMMNAMVISMMDIKLARHD